MKSLIVGKGQIGSALYEVLKSYKEILIRDMEPLEVKDVDVLHICFPDSDRFVEFVQNYQDAYRPILTIIHSSISVGTTNKLHHVVYSPMRGRHPHLKDEIKKFPKFLSSNNSKDLDYAISYFKGCEWEILVNENPSCTELVKLLSNIHMGLEIAWAQEVKRIVESFGGDKSIYHDWEQSYTKGYRAVGQEHLIRPLMSPSPIGGHCIKECTEILSAQYPSLAFEFIKKSDEMAKNELARKN